MKSVGLSLRTLHVWLRKINKLSQFLLRFVLAATPRPKTIFHPENPNVARFCRTAVTLQFVSHSFLDYHDPTIGELLPWKKKPPPPPPSMTWP